MAQLYDICVSTVDEAGPTKIIPITQSSQSPPVDEASATKMIWHLYVCASLHQSFDDLHVPMMTIVVMLMMVLLLMMIMMLLMMLMMMMQLYPVFSPGLTM